MLLKDNVLIQEPGSEMVDELLQLLSEQKFEDVSMITLTSSDKKAITAHIKSKFQLIEAGGGIVKKGDKYLMIHRKGVWDLPKGKLEVGEEIKECALREVEEETGVKVEAEGKIASIWHTYLHKKKNVLKKTHWYAMTCLDDSEMGPQLEEKIEKVEWKTLKEMEESLVDSYRSLRYLVQKFKELEQ